jgi:murein DD-endopeptidase MepM/ murein hydrolase activator NlpD
MMNRMPFPLLTTLLCLALALPASAAALELRGQAVQGGLMFGEVAPGSRVTLDDRELLVSPEGRFVIGFGRDEKGPVTLVVSGADGAEQKKTFGVAPRTYRVEKVEGLPPRTVTPSPADAERIKREIALVSTARKRVDERTDYASGFAWPASGRISGVYGSQRVLNGEPRRPHYGLDIAAPTGTPVQAPAAGVVTLAEPDMFYSGGTIILDHGQGLSSSFLHLSKVLVEVGEVVEQGAVIAEIGATGRASGPHLDWRMNWLDRRVDPQLLMEGEPPALPAAE